MTNGITETISLILGSLLISKLLGDYPEGNVKLRNKTTFFSCFASTSGTFVVNK